MRKTDTPKDHIVFFAAIFVYIAAFMFNESARRGVISGMEICLDSVVPSLFPMLIISSFITNLGIPESIKKIVFYPIKKITGVHENAAESFIFGTTAGYPVGVKTAYSLYKQNKLSLSDAQNAALINVNPGLAFSVIVTGKIFFGSTVSGISLFLSVTVGNLLTGILLNRKKLKNTPKNTDTESTADFSLCLIDAVSSSVKSIVSICAWITAFSAFSAPLGEAIKTPYIKIFLEVTSGAALCAEKGLLPLCAFTMGFGGLCVFFQLLSELKGLEISAVKYFACRLFSGCAAFITEKVIISIIPIKISAFSSGETYIRLSSVSLSGSLALIFLCSVFMLSVYGNSETGTCHTQKNVIK